MDGGGEKGWRLLYTQRIVDTHLSRRTEIVLARMLAWEACAAAGPGNNIVRLASATPRPPGKGGKRA